jgi:lipoprotein NlpD
MCPYCGEQSNACAQGKCDLKQETNRIPTGLLCVAIAAIALIAGCSSPKYPAPVESRAISKSKAGSTSTKPGVGATASSLAPAPDGFYRVRRGDTLIGISLDHGVAWRDLAAWNQIDNPNLIEVDQLLRVRPPIPTNVASVPRATSDPKQQAEIRPLAADKSASGPLPSQQPAAPAATAPATKAADGIQLSWPTPGRVITQFADPGYKGIALAGAEGDPILAAGDGRVVYSGSGLRGYGNLVIVKHDGDFLTAYAHNKTILVAEGQNVKRGQKIAELGKTDSDVPKLHFEVRRSGKPVDPLKYLAQR